VIVASRAALTGAVHHVSFPPKRDGLHLVRLLFSWSFQTVATLHPFSVRRATGCRRPPAAGASKRSLTPHGLRSGSLVAGSLAPCQRQRVKPGSRIFPPTAPSGRNYRHLLLSLRREATCTPGEFSPARAAEPDRGPPGWKLRLRPDAMRHAFASRRIPIRCSTPHEKPNPTEGTPWSALRSACNPSSWLSRTASEAFLRQTVHVVPDVLQSARDLGQPPVSIWALPVDQQTGHSLYIVPGS